MAFREYRPRTTLTARTLYVKFISFLFFIVSHKVKLTPQMKHMNLTFFSLLYVIGVRKSPLIIPEHIIFEP